MNKLIATLALLPVFAFGTEVLLERVPKEGLHLQLDEFLLHHLRAHGDKLHSTAWLAISKPAPASARRSLRSLARKERTRPACCLQRPR